MLKGKKLLDYTNLFSKITINLLKEYLKMNNIIELTDKAERTANRYRLDEINKIRDYFDNEIKERKDIINKLNKYLVSFDYLDKIFITLSASFGTLSIASQATVIGIPAGITGAYLTLIFTIGTGISKSLLKVTKKRKKKHNKIFIDNNIDIIESTLAPMNDYFDSCKKCYSHYYYSCYYYRKKKLYVFFLRIDIKNFMKNYKIIF